MAKYLKPDSELGYIEDGVSVEFLKFNNMRHTILGFMLGDFDDEGKYVVSAEIKKELIEMPKHIVDVLESVEICQSNLKLDKPVTFMINYEGNKASLVLIEKLSFEANFKLNSGTYSNINEYVLDQVETSGEINRNVLYQRWHIGEFGGEVIDIFSCGEEILAKYFGLVSRFKYLLEANSILLTKENELDEIEAEYANSVWDIIKHYPKFGESVTKQVKESLNKKKEFFKLDKPNFCKTFNELLLNAVESNLNVLSEQERKEFESENRNALNVVNIKRKNTLDYVKGEVQTRELSGLTLQEVAARYVEKVNQFKTADKNVQRLKLISNLETIGIGLSAKKEETSLVAKAAEKNLEVKAENQKSSAPNKSANKDDKKTAAKKKASAAKKTENGQSTKKDSATKPAKDDAKTDEQTSPADLLKKYGAKKKRLNTTLAYGTSGSQTQDQENVVGRADAKTMTQQFGGNVVSTNINRDVGINETNTINNGGLGV